MKNKWENANFLITAKKCIDSFLYISKNVLELSNLDLRERIDKFAKTLPFCFNKERPSSINLQD